MSLHYQCFPIIEKGEHVFSPFYRFLMADPVPNKKQLLKSAFGLEKLLLKNELLQKDIGIAVELQSHNMNPAEVVRNHSVRGFYELFTPVHHLPLNKSNLERARTVNYVNSWRWCVECAACDLKAVGFPYWHVMHQLPGVSKCYRHSCNLVTECIHCGYQNIDLSSVAKFYFSTDCPKCGSTVDRIATRETDFTVWLHSMVFDIWEEKIVFDYKLLQSMYRDFIGVQEAPKSLSSLSFQKLLAPARNKMRLNISQQDLRYLFRSKVLSTPDVFVSLPIIHAAYDPQRLYHPLIHLFMIWLIWGSDFKKVLEDKSKVYK